MENNSILFQAMQRTLQKIIKDAGGASAIAKASEGKVTVDAVYKWPRIGIPDRHWGIVMLLARATADELLASNEAARRRGA